ncbi:unnamed protein product, partial [Ixodes hexagonus]
GGAGQSYPVAKRAHAQTLRRDTNIVELPDADRIPRWFPSAPQPRSKKRRRRPSSSGECQQHHPYRQTTQGRGLPKESHGPCSASSSAAYSRAHTEARRRPHPRTRGAHQKEGRRGPLMGDVAAAPSGGARTDEKRTSRVPGRPPRITEHPRDVVVRKHEPVTLRCRADADPPARISWFHEGRPVRNSATRMVLPEGQLFFLHVQHSRRDQDTGVYWCAATNPLGESRSRNASVELA